MGQDYRTAPAAQRRWGRSARPFCRWFSTGPKMRRYSFQKTNKTKSGFGHTRVGRICQNRHIWWFGVFVFVLKKKLKTNTCGGEKGTSWPGC